MRLTEHHNNDWSAENLFVNHPLPMWIYDGATLEFLEVNKSAITHYGYSQAEFLQMKLTDVHLSEDLPILLPYLAETSNFSKNLHQPEQWRHICKNGQMIFVESESRRINYAGRDARLADMRDITQFRSALAEKEVLLKEIHHRVKNNLQIISSLLELQSQTVKDPEVHKALRESRNRIESISLVHKNLYTNSNIGHLNIAEYINNLVDSLIVSYQVLPNKVEIQTNIDTVDLTVDQAIACGLVVNELVSNSLKHAFPEMRTGKITIHLYTENSNVKLTIQDNGVGLPNGLDWTNTTSLGLSLVYDLVVEQLEGNITIERCQGSTYRIQFPQST